MNSERTPLAGVVGWPIAHSKSPIIHGHWLQRYRIKGHYVPLGINAPDFEGALRALPKLGFAGVNITIPHKERALSIATKITDRAAAIGAANTITFQNDGGILADNTDGVGFINNIRQQAPTWDAATGPAIVLGAGGAARAVISSLLAEGAPKVIVSNRTISRAEMLCDHFGAAVEVREWSGVSDVFAGAATIVNATPLGMVGQPELKVNFSRAPASVLVTDIVYNPLRTEFLRLAEERKLAIVDGLGMLLHQAVPGFYTWFGTMPEVDDELRSAVLAG